MNKRCAWWSAAAVLAVLFVWMIVLQGVRWHYRVRVFQVKEECLPSEFVGKRGWIGEGWRWVTGRDRLNVREVFEQAGVMFPLGTYAEYDVSDQTIVVMNTTNNLEAVQVQLTTLEVEPAVVVDVTAVEVVDPEWLDVYQFAMPSADALMALSTNQCRVIHQLSGMAKLGMTNIVTMLRRADGGQMEEKDGHFRWGKDDEGEVMKIEAAKIDHMRLIHLSIQWESREQIGMQTTLSVTNKTVAAVFRSEALASEVVMADRKSKVFRLDVARDPYGKPVDDRCSGARFLIVGARWECVGRGEVRNGDG